jgi:hypothetical protein
VFLLVSSSFGGRTSPPTLLQDATLLWVINVATFAVWYWEIDGGGPAPRLEACSPKCLVVRFSEGRFFPCKTA